MLLYIHHDNYYSNNSLKHLIGLDINYICINEQEIDLKLLHDRILQKYYKEKLYDTDYSTVRNNI